MQKCQVNVYLILLQDEKILMMRRANTGFKDGMYSLPAGKTDPGETIWEAIIREAQEEVGVEIAPQKKEWMKTTYILHRYSHQGTVAFDFFLLLKEFNGTVQNKEPHKCDDLAWIPINNLPPNTIPYVKRGISNALNGIIFDEYIWD